MVYMYEVMDMKDGNIYSYDQMVEMYDQDHLNYSYVSKRLCCPCCKNEVIEISINDQDAIIKSKRMLHKTYCDYYGFKVSQQDMKKRIKNKIGFTDLLNNETKKVIPKKGIVRPFTEDDLDMLKLFYGPVIIKPAHSKDESRYRNFSFKAKRGDSFVVSFVNKTDNLENIEYLEDNIDKEVNIKIIAKLTKSDKYYNMLLAHHSLFIKQ